MPGYSMGPETDSRLEDIGDALEGKKVLQEPYVDKKTILMALKEQNAVIRMMQMAFFQNQERMQTIEETFKVQTETINQLKGKVEYFETAVEKIEDMEAKTADFTQKMETFDDVVNKVSEQGTFVATMSNQLQTQTQQLSTFKSEITNTVESAKQDLTVLQTTAEKLETNVTTMGDTIEITSAQIKHETVGGEEVMLNEFVNQTEHHLSDIQEHVDTADEHMKQTGGVMEKLDEGTVDELKVMSTDFKSLMEWKEEQAGIDLVDIRRSQDSIKEAIDTVQRDMFEKIAREEVDTKLETKFESIIDHLQSALNSTESDEADFKAVTANLNQVCESLKSDKADKTEIAALRKQFLQHSTSMMGDGGAVNLGGGGGGGPEVDPEDLAEALQNYMTAHQINHELHKKADKHVVEQVDTMNGEVERVKDTIRILIQQHEMLQQQLAANSNQVEQYRRASMSPVPGGGGNQEEKVAGGEWKGLAGAMRVDAGGEAGVVESGNFPISERNTMPREASTPLVESSVAPNNNNSGAQSRPTEKVHMTAPQPAPVQQQRQEAVAPQTPQAANVPVQQQQQQTPQAAVTPQQPFTPLPAIAPMAGMDFMPLKQPQKMLDEASGRKSPAPTPLPVIPSMPAPANTSNLMMGSSAMSGNPVFENMVDKPGALDQTGVADAVTAGIEMGLGGPRQATSSRPGTRGDELQVGDMDSQGFPRQRTTRAQTPEDQPIVHRDKMTDLNPGMTYGGGFQIFSPEKGVKGEIRGLDQTTTLPEMQYMEKKMMIEGDDKKLYVGDKDVLGGD
ncbi:hypothetical protein TrST_g8993 [Triparma strigata]|uniref:Uncharacterized protein n=1 Tax=Triparma strigata TaxID=1606541 RepID=A0A9W7BL54_9STRA|nr:hypothetical protein TrST_g8993 [Triparma strigata]